MMMIRCPGHLTSEKDLESFLGGGNGVWLNRAGSMTEYVRSPGTITVERPS